MIHPARRWPPPVLAIVLLATACTAAADTDRTSAAPDDTAASPSPSADAVVRRLPAAQWERMVTAGMWREGCPATRTQLRRVEINHHGFDDKVHRGVLVVHTDTADTVVRVFTRLFDERFPIRKMRPLEEYDGDSDASLRDDNTAAYNCRRPDQINAPEKESPHANGRAVDINPLENPWQDPRCKCWSPSARHKERTAGKKGVIVKGGTVWKVFKEEGWIWQDIDVPDYMHFDTGYPSKPYTAPETRR
ncbi:M15 family metallopeptidase [Streptomyces yatensis]|uniref:Peptidase M15C domain-containing protein n=1 Tax=Streptomyces yatensis TaxID=155177 RepID=A0ABN2INB0_9ACTN|nr:M15 family metallopeptidase [Streptomyces yatensis]